MKKIIIPILILLSLILFSCNVDGTEGILQAAGTSTKKDSISIQKIIGKNDDNYYVATDSFTALYDGGYGEKKGNGIKSTYSLYRDASNWLYTDGNGKYFNNEEEFNDFDGKKLTSSFSIDGTNHTNHTYLFKDDNGYSYLYSTNPITTNALTPLREGEASIVGDGYIFISGKDGNFYFDCKNNIEKQVGLTIKAMNDKYIYASDGYVYKTSDLTKVSDSRTSNPQVHPLLISQGDKTYLFNPGDANLYIISENNVEIKTISGLSSIVVIGYYNADDNNITVLTANSGKKTINLNSSSVE